MSSQSHQSSSGDEFRRSDHVPTSSHAPTPALFRANPFLDEDEQAMEIQEPSGIEAPLPNAFEWESFIDSLLLVLDEPEPSTGLTPGIATLTVGKILKAFIYSLVIPGSLYAKTINILLNQLEKLEAAKAA